MTAVVKERIQILNNDDEESSENCGENQIALNLQTQEGRKSRIKFLIFKVGLKFLKQIRIDSDLLILIFKQTKG